MAGALGDRVNNPADEFNKRARQNRSAGHKGAYDGDGRGNCRHRAGNAPDILCSGRHRHHDV